MTHAELREIAGKATKDWSSGVNEHVSYHEMDRDEPAVFNSQGPRHTCDKADFFARKGIELRQQVIKDCRFIDAASPDRIIALLDELERYRTALEEIAEPLKDRGRVEIAERWAEIHWRQICGFQNIASQALKGPAHE